MQVNLFPQAYFLCKKGGIRIVATVESLLEYGEIPILLLGHGEELLFPGLSGNPEVSSALARFTEKVFLLRVHYAQSTPDRVSSKNCCVDDKVLLSKLFNCF